MKLSWFKREDGSTTLTMVLAIALVVVLLAASVQWYWTYSSSSDIQVLADLGALGAADVTAKSVMLIQALDALLLTANLFGLLVHAVVVVAGVVAVLSAPTGGGGAAFFEKALEFDRKFCEKRREFAKQAHQLAKVVSEATPYLAMAQAYRVVNENAAYLEGFNGTSYFATAIPFPFRGEVELTGYPADEDALFEEVSTAGEENESSAREIKRLEEEIEHGVDECFRLDIFKPVGTQRAYWDPPQAIRDFRRGFSELVSESPPAVSALIPIEDNARNRQSLATHYAQDYLRLGRDLREKAEAHFARQQAEEAGVVVVSDIDANAWLAAERTRQVFLLDHNTGERRAYHQKANCFGLAGAKATLRTVTLGSVMGQSDHPPCVLCAPPHWRALEVWSKQLGEYVHAWNAEAAALRAWHKAKERLDVEQDAVTERTRGALESIVDEAGGYLMGGRLKYTPAGARGFLCVAVSTSERRLPDFTLPALTGSGGARLGRQMAVAGARLMPSATESTIPSLLSDSQKGAEAGLDEGFGGVTRALMSDGEERSFLGDGVLTFALGLWGTCLSLYTKGSAKLENAVSGLPLGLDSLMSACLRKLGDVAQISAPDLRRPQPTLVDTADIGDAGAAGAEGAFVRALSGAKSGLERLGGASAAGFREAIRAAVNELDSDVSAHVDKLMNITVLGVQIPLPFSESVQTLCGRAFEVLRNKEEELFAMLGVGAW